MTYEGWTNRETWAVMELLANDKDFYLAALANAGEVTSDLHTGEKLVCLLREFYDPAIDSIVGKTWRINLLELGKAWRAEVAQKEFT